MHNSAVLYFHPATTARELLEMIGDVEAPISTIRKAAAALNRTYAEMRSRDAEFDGCRYLVAKSIFGTARRVLADGGEGETQLKEMMELMDRVEEEIKTPEDRLRVRVRGCAVELKRLLFTSGAM